ncbi:hypothetical protein EZV62_021549 [Acer yangbiense]|uniref:BRI1 kinase inhibitor 1 n=1 Tax=Acer yangbiense TaxID=1000413 RepID=A0A5C7H5Y4_9ROSI|nr:hypothetical protein EZV62_021549 [Acer yangbiense]
MELTNQHQIMTKDKVVDRRLLQESNSNPKQAGLGVSKQQQQQQQQQSAATSPAAAASPPSSSSSPNHEFSFTISLHHSSSNPVLPSDHKTNNKSSTSTPPSSAFAIDLSPADDIFFHGHLLPLHLLSHLPTVSPRSSTNSMESFTLPIREMIDEDDYDGYQKTNRKNCSTSDSNIIINNNNKSKSTHQENNTKGTRTKSKSFSLFKFSRRKKGFEDRELPEEEEDNNRDMNKQKKRLRFDHVSHVIKKYMKMVRPLLFKRRENQNVHFNGQAYSFSGNLMSYRNKQDHQMMMRSGKRGEFSAPASIRTSPTNSGLLVATTTTSLSSSTSDSTMEELQAAIQAAIAHCKNSIAVEDKLKC